MQRGGYIYTPKMKHLVVRIIHNTGHTVCRDELSIGRAKCNFEEKLANAQELGNGVGRVGIRGHGSGLYNIAGNMEIWRVSRVVDGFQTGNLQDKEAITSQSNRLVGMQKTIRICIAQTRSELEQKRVVSQRYGPVGKLQVFTTTRVEVNEGRIVHHKGKSGTCEVVK